MPEGDSQQIQGNREEPEEARRRQPEGKEDPGWPRSAQRGTMRTPRIQPNEQIREAADVISNEAFACGTSKTKAKKRARERERERRLETARALEGAIICF